MKVTIESEESKSEVKCLAGPTLLQLLQDSDFQVDSVCGGGGTCLKCRVQVKGFCPTSSIDKKAFTETEIREGWRLSCQCRPRTNISVHIPKVENYRKKPRVTQRNITLKNPKLICDLGSTGVVVALGDDFETIACEAHLLNKQVRYGGDVMTRLHNATKFGVKSLQNAQLKTIELCLKELETLRPEDFSKAAKHPVICAGNSAMTSLLHAWDIQNLAVSPYQPEQTDTCSTIVSNSIFLQTPPLLGGFVGADTTAAILYLESLKTQTPWMMTDIGTNTEIVLKDDSGTYWFASAPAGPAFEGGNITKGMRAEPGAVSEAKYESDKWQLKTIGNDVPKGICGSGLIEIIDQAVQHNLIHKDGLVPGGQLTVSDRIFLMADDVREFQLAKSATRTAIDVLIKRAGVTPRKIYFAGTFASHLNQTSVKRLGLLPPDIPVENIGNGSLKGAFVYASLSGSERKSFADKLNTQKRQIELALEDDFQAAFVNNLGF